MNGNSLVIDTNIALYLLAGDKTLSYALDGKSIYLSFITELELLSYFELDDYEKEVVKQFVRDCIVIDINKEIKNKTIEFRSSFRMKLPDAIIAATANYLKQPLMTADKDFKKVAQIDLIFYER